MKKTISIFVMAIAASFANAETYNVNVYPHRGIDSSIPLKGTVPDMNKSMMDGFEFGQRIKAAREKKNLEKKQQAFQEELLSITNNMTEVSREKLSLMLVKYPEFSAQIEQIARMHNLN